MNILELTNGLRDILTYNNNSLVHAYEGVVTPILGVIADDAKLLYEISNRTLKEINELDIKTFYTEVNLCKTIKKLNP